jgi:hypothetical protein
MKLWCLFSLRNGLTALIVIFFLMRGLQLYLKLYKSDIKIDTSQLINQQPFEGDTNSMYLRKIENRLK